MAEQSKNWTGVIAALGTVASLLLAYNTYQVSQFDTDLRRAESEREVNFRIYQSIAEAVESGNPQRIRAVRALVEALSSEGLRDPFLSALESGEVQIFAGEEATTARVRTEQPSFNWEDWDYDVFWCSGSGVAAEAQATAIVEALRAENAKGRIRVRVLPQSVREQGAYRSMADYEIRYEANEQAQATAVKALAERTMAVQGFRLNQIAPQQRTPWYVSLFICPAAATPAA
jgi:hypothetical protein